MTREEAIEIINRENDPNNKEVWEVFPEVREALDMAIQALQAQADGDLISRQAVIDCFKKWQPYMATRLHEFENELSELPTVAIPNKVGHWVEMGTNGDGTHNICCGVCGIGKLKSKGHANSEYTNSKYKFCINCGCPMVIER